MSKAFREALFFVLWFIYIYISIFFGGAQAGYHGVELDKDLHHTMDFMKHGGFACGAQSCQNLPCVQHKQTKKRGTPCNA